MAAAEAERRLVEADRCSLLASCSFFKTNMFALPRPTPGLKRRHCFTPAPSLAPLMLLEETCAKTQPAPR